ncbi:hypothetical protein Efla_004393 [Eimeria flavescens]
MACAMQCEFCAQERCDPVFKSLEALCRGNPAQPVSWYWLVVDAVSPLHVHLPQWLGLTVDVATSSCQGLQGLEMFLMDVHSRLPYVLSPVGIRPSINLWLCPQNLMSLPVLMRKQCILKRGSAGISVAAAAGMMLMHQIQAGQNALVQGYIHV